MDDLDYLFSTARIRAMEGKLLSAQRLNEMIDARTLDDAERILSDAGWESPIFISFDAMEETISRERAKIYKELNGFVPEKRIIKVFQLPYDYHNLKAIIKGRAIGKDYAYMLSDAGTIPSEKLNAIIAEKNFSPLSPAMKNAVSEAIETLNRTGDPFYSDTVLDRACYSEMMSIAKATESDFLKKYIALKIDTINLLTAVRIKKRGMNYEFIRQSFIEGGNLGLNKLLTELSPDTLETLFAKSDLLSAARIAGKVIKGDEKLAALDKACDDCLMEYLHSAKYIGLGEQPLIGYIGAKETELTDVKIVFGGKLVQENPEITKRRLRETYV